MKSFFVIKGSPNTWYDQQGNKIKNVKGYISLPNVKSIAEDPIGAEHDIDSTERVPTIRLWYHVRICKDEQEVLYNARLQNL
ncbi:MAG TPA: hypothetical protein VEA37_05445 [Flavobacterium sp.]|nr:hypothetical protein [Flavobacterium sp.]